MSTKRPLKQSVTLTDSIKIERVRSKKHDRRQSRSRELFPDNGNTLVDIFLGRAPPLKRVHHRSVPTSLTKRQDQAPNSIAADSVLTADYSTSSWSGDSRKNVQRTSNGIGKVVRVFETAAAKTADDVNTTRNLQVAGSSRSKSTSKGSLMRTSDDIVSSARGEAEDNVFIDIEGVTYSSEAKIKSRKIRKSENLYGLLMSEGNRQVPFAHEGVNTELTESEVAIPNAAEGGRAVIRSFPKSEFTKPSTAVEELTISSSKPKSKRFKKQGLSKQVIGIDALTAKSGSGKDDKDAAQKAGLEQKGKRGKPDVQEGNRNPDRSESKARANSSRKRPRSDDTPGDPRVEP
ncbi:hypothetical protein CVT26_006772, partial [Gymnopilus dilepis]